MTVTLLPDTAFTFMMIFARMGAVIMLLPAIGDRSVPVNIRLVLALAVTLVFYPAVQPMLPAVPAGIAGMVAAIMLELLIGLFLGLVLRMIVMALTVAGTTIAFQMGLGFALSADPTQNGGQGAVIGTFLSVLGATLILVADLHHPFIVALRDSYVLFAPGEMLSIGDVLQAGLTMFAAAFRLGIQMAAPFIAFGLLFYLGLGILSRLMPQMQIFFIAMPLNILLGFLMLGILLVALMSWYLEQVERAVQPFLAG